MEETAQAKARSWERTERVPGPAGRAEGKGIVGTLNACVTEAHIGPCIYMMWNPVIFFNKGTAKLCQGDKLAATYRAGQ